MKRRKLQLIILSLVAGIGLSSCYPDEPDTFEDSDVVITEFDTDFDFGTKRYFLLPDTVTVITDDDSYEKTEEEIELDETIVNEIEAQMSEAGYTRLTLDDTSNTELMDQAVVMLASRATVNYVNYYYDYYYYGRSYWSWYPGLSFYYPGYYYDYYYPWGYPVNLSYSYAVGTVIIEMIDAGDPFEIDDDNGEVSYTVRWLAVLNGLAELSLDNTQERITDGIEQAFNQSPYIYE